MDGLVNIKVMLLTFFGLIGGIIAGALGGFDMILSTLLTLMIIDYLTGLVVAGVFKRSRKTPGGALDSNVGAKGLFKKGMILLMVLIAYKLDLLAGTEIIRSGVIMAYILNEIISITENAGIMGVPIPRQLMRAIEMLKAKEEGEELNG